MPVRPLPAELAEKARVELGEDPQRLQDGIQHLKDWIVKQPHLRARTDDQWLASFLRGCKHSVERAKEKIDLYYSMRSIAPELYTINHRDSKFKEILKLGTLLVLPNKTRPTDPRPLLMRFGSFDPNKFNILEVMAATVIMSKILYMEDDQLMICGSVGIMDMEGVSMGHFSQVTLAMMKKMTVLGQDAAPVRMKGNHYLNTPTGFETIFNIAKSFLNEKNKQRLHVHNKDFDALYKFIPKETMPAEYGGDAGTLQELTERALTMYGLRELARGTQYKINPCRDLLRRRMPSTGRLLAEIHAFNAYYWIKKVEEYSDWLDEDLQYGTDESKRPGKPKTAEDMFGAEGSFRQLQID